MAKKPTNTKPRRKKSATDLTRGQKYEILTSEDFGIQLNSKNAKIVREFGQEKFQDFLKTLDEFKDQNRAVDYMMARHTRETKSKKVTEKDKKVAKKEMQQLLEKELRESGATKKQAKEASKSLKQSLRLKDIIEGKKLLQKPEMIHKLIDTNKKGRLTKEDRTNVIKQFIKEEKAGEIFGLLPVEEEKITSKPFEKVVDYFYGDNWFDDYGRRKAFGGLNKSRESLNDFQFLILDLAEGYNAKIINEYEIKGVEVSEPEPGYVYAKKILVDGMTPEEADHFVRSQMSNANPLILSEYYAS